MVIGFLRDISSYLSVTFIQSFSLLLLLLVSVCLSVYMSSFLSFPHSNFFLSLNLLSFPHSAFFPSFCSFPLPKQPVWVSILYLKLRKSSKYSLQLILLHCMSQYVRSLPFLVLFTFFQNIFFSFRFSNILLPYSLSPPFIFFFIPSFAE